jgi:hypothetical protein
MAQEDPNIFFRELMKSKPTPETRADWLANHLKLVDLGEKAQVREKPFSYSGFVRDDGTLRLSSGRVTTGTDMKGYRMHCVNRGVHRLVAEAFVENPRPDIFDMVDHIDHNRSNNHYTNLRWLDSELNCANRKASKNVMYVKSMKTKKWTGSFKVGKKRFRKTFETEAEASEWAHRQKAVAWQKLYEKKLTQTKP